jgi:hypothetical protein
LSFKCHLLSNRFPLWAFTPIQNMRSKTDNNDFIKYNSLKAPR